MAQMSRAKIQDGVWKRNVHVTWKNQNGWRTSIHKSVLADPRLRECHYVLEGDSTALIPIEELRRVVIDGPDYDNERIWGPFNIDPVYKTVAGKAVRMRVIHADNVVPEDSPEIMRLKQELDALQARPETPELLRELQRVLKLYERPSQITQYVKRTRSSVCQLCGELGFIKRDGTRYCEVHHLFHLSTNPPSKCLAPKYLVVLCATCHRRMHYADVGEPVQDGASWRVRVDDHEHHFIAESL
jgi:5-methylcytosine-specific restriction endonuclease McrA